MSIDLSMWLPEGISPAIAGLLIAFSVVTSFITAALSLGGGILMLSIFTLVLPPIAIVPVHGLVQLGSNAGRGFLQRAHVHWDLVLWMGLGAIGGSILGAQVALVLPARWLTAIIGLFVLFSVWVPTPRVSGRGPLATIAAGAAIGAIGMLVGATGPLAATFLRYLKERRELVATHAMIMVALHLIKIIVFSAIGFAFASYLPLVLMMIVSGFVGTFLGGKVLARLPERAFRIGFRLVLSIVALDLLRRAAFG